MCKVFYNNHTYLRKKKKQKTKKFKRKSLFNRKINKNTINKLLPIKDILNKSKNLIIN